MSFLYSAAFLALPLAALPLVLHLLFRRKSPVVLFSTLRFVRVSVQQTAARKRVHRWLLLLCRVLLLLLLVSAIVQPVCNPIGASFGGGDSLAAAVVVDTSYSMMLQDGQMTLLDKAGQTVRDLLQGPLAGARVAIFTSRPSGDRETLTKSGSEQAPLFFKPLEPQATRIPLGERVNAAMALLSNAGSQQKWLIIISDLQTREFPRPVPDFPDGRVLLIDLHPDEARSAGVTRVAVEPDQPLPGLESEVVVEVTGRAGDTRAISVNVAKLDGTIVQTRPPQMASFDGTGRSLIRFPVQLPAERWLLVNGVLAGDDAMAWDNQRSHLVEIPPRQIVSLLEARGQVPAQRFLRLALDPYAGTVNTWPLDAKSQNDLTGHENAVVVPLTEWPGEARALKLRDFARGGGTVILCLQPGLEESWAGLGENQKSALLELLPSAPQTTPPPDGSYRTSPSSATPDALLAGLTDEKFQLKAIVVRRFVAFTRLAPRDSAKVTSILNVTPINPGPPPQGILFRRTIGPGTVYTLGTLGDSRYTNLVTHPLFLPLLVRMCLRPSTQSNALNVELGDPIVLAAAQFAGINTLFVDPPGGAPAVKVDAIEDHEKGHLFQFKDATAPGVYAWRLPSESAPLAMVNVTLPAHESELTYRAAANIVHPGPRTLTARSFAELQKQMEKINEPQPLWSWPIMIVLLLLCLEALMGSVSKLRQGTGKPKFSMAAARGI